MTEHGNTWAARILDGSQERLHMAKLKLTEKAIAALPAASTHASSCSSGACTGRLFKDALCPVVVRYSQWSGGKYRIEGFGVWRWQIGSGASPGIHFSAITARRGRCAER